MQPIPTTFDYPPTPADCLCGRFVLCCLCAIWMPVREDSVADDHGICPRRLYPDNITNATDGCRTGVFSKE